jgi:site-specific recombinase XerC
MQTWLELRTEYEAAELTGRSAYARRLWELAADDLQRLAGPVAVADVTDALLVRFAVELAREGADAASVAIEVGLVRDALAWAASRRVRLAA